MVGFQEEGKIPKSLCMDNSPSGKRGRLTNVDLTSQHVYHCRSIMNIFTDPSKDWGKILFPRNFGSPNSWLSQYKSLCAILYYIHRCQWKTSTSDIYEAKNHWVGLKHRSLTWLNSMTVGSSMGKHEVLKIIQGIFPGKFRRNIPGMRQDEQFSRAVPFHTDLTLSFVE